MGNNYKSILTYTVVIKKCYDKWVLQQNNRWITKNKTKKASRGKKKYPYVAILQTKGIFIFQITFSLANFLKHVRFIPFSNKFRFNEYIGLLLQERYLRVVLVNCLR